MRVIGLIPAKYQSDRLNGKLLADIHGRSVLEWTYRAANKAASFDFCAVASADQIIIDHVRGFGGAAVTTALGNRNGTECCREAAEVGAHAEADDIIINVQGDEPAIRPEHLDALVKCFEDPAVSLATLVTPVRSSEDLWSESTTKVILSLPDQRRVLYFSRWPIPYCLGVPRDKWHEVYGNLTYYRHVGIYGYRMSTLRKIVALSPNPLSRAESLEQLRWLQNGYVINAAMIEHPHVAINTPEDLEKARHNWNST
jgi:3-deoxy-manno-octulosonate cytidylyltransferase (CMP-KDO synthetase)